MSAAQQSAARVCIVIPTRARPHFLRVALASALNQTHRELRVLVCDNAGDEATAVVVRDLNDGRVEHVVRERDLGMLRNAVLGFACADADFVMKLDDDDRLHPRAVELLLEPLLGDPNATLAFASFDFVDVDGVPCRRETVAHQAASGRADLRPGRHQPFDALVATGAVQLVAALVRHDAVDWEAVPGRVDTAYDRHIALQASRDGAAAWYVAQTLADYRLHPDSDSNRALTRQLTGSLAAMEFAVHEGRHVHTAVLRAQTRRAAELLGRQLLRDGRPVRATQVAVHGARYGLSTTLIKLLILALLPAPWGTRIARRGLQRHLRRAGTTSTVPLT